MGQGMQRYINVFFKYILGWLDPVILTEESPIQTLELYAGEHWEKFEEEARAVLYTPDREGLPFKEFFIAEYRNNADMVEEYKKETGVTLWHCIADLGEWGDFRYLDKHLRSVRPTGGAENMDFTAADFFVPQGPPWNAYSTSSVLSPGTTPTNSDFENGVPTQFYMEVLDQDEDRAVLKVGSLSAYAPAQETLRILPAELTYGDVGVQLATEGGSGMGGVTWELLSGDAIALTADGRATARHVGKCRVKATKAGDAACPAPVSASLTVTVKPKNIASDVFVVCSPLEYYTGEPIRPVPQVIDPNAVITAEDYDVSYRDNIELGKGSILLTGKGNYEGTKAVTFQIVRKETITTPEQLRQLAVGVNSGDDSYCQGYFELAADIDLGGEACPWTPIGSRAKPFSGVFDGKGHSVTGIYVNGNQDQGLFGNLDRDGQIKNLCVGGAVSGTAYVGGIVGRNVGKIVHCYNTCSVSSIFYAGGIAGTNSGTIENCYSVGKVSGRDRVGGITGQSLEGVVKNCYNYAPVEGESSQVGSLVGNASGKVEGCYYLSGTADKGLGSGDAPGVAEEKSAEGFWEESGFPGWDFVNVWVMNDAPERPVLRSVPELPDHIHSYSADWKRDETGHWRECECGERTGESAHDPVEDAGREPTCAIPGKTAGSHCEVCGYVIERQQTVPAKGHQYAETWDRDGTGHWHECTVCGDKNDSAPHREDEGRVTKEPTLEETGLRLFSCQVCGYELRTETLPRLEPAHEHEYSADWKRDEMGHWRECLICFEKKDAGLHSWDEGRVTTSATASEMGVRTYTCTVCAQTRDESIPATGGGTVSDSGSAGKSYPITVKKGSAGGVIAIAPKWAERGENVSVTVQVTKGYELTGIMVADDRGKALTLIEQGTGYTFVMPSSEVTVTAEFHTLPPEEKRPEYKSNQSPIFVFPFEDVKTDAWYYGTVVDIFKKGLMAGITETRFAPDAFTSRGMVVQALYRIEGEPVTERGSFSDVGNGKYYAGAAAWAAEKGIIEGYGDGTFRPDSFITREELATVLYRYAVYKGYDTMSLNALDQYRDAGQISTYAREAMRWANGTGLLTGRRAEELSPLGNLTRSEMAAVLLRFCKEGK